MQVVLQVDEGGEKAMVVCLLVFWRVVWQKHGEKV